MREGEIYEFGTFRISIAEGVLRRDNRIVPLTPKCFDTLLVLAQHGGSVVEKEKLMRAVWPNSFVEEGNLSQNIFTLRKTLGETAEGEQYIQTIPKRGYRLAVPVAETGPAVRTERAAAAQLQAVYGAPRRISYVIAASALVAAVLVAAHWVWPRDRFIPSPQITLLTVPNNMIGATISPDGTRIAYISHDAEGQSLWVRETGGVGAGTRLVPPAPGHFWGVGYSLKGDYVYYVFEDGAHSAEGVLSRISAEGGESRKLVTGISGAPAFSPDGGRMVFKRYDPNGHGYLLTATPLGADIKTIAQSDATYPFYSYQWAADGKKIYYVERTNDSNASAWSIWEIPIGGGAARLLMAPQPKPLRSANWLNRTEILALIPDEDSGMRQIWRVSLGGALRRLTNGINDYSSISLTSDARRLLASSIETHDSIWTASAPGKTRTEPVRMALPAGTYNDPVWTADGAVAFVGQSNLWLSTVDGRERKPLIPGKVAASEPAVSADGRFVVFVSQRGNSRNLWRIDIDGANLRQVTSGQYDWHLALSPDGKWVAYESRDAGQRALWKAPLGEAGSPVKLVDKEGAEAGIAIAPDSKLFAYRTDLGEIGIRSLDDGTLVRTMTAPSDPSDLHWSPDSKTIAYVCHMGRSVQLWNQPIAGGSAAPILEPLPNDVLHIAWSRDASRIVYLHREIKVDLALITSFR